MEDKISAPQPTSRMRHLKARLANKRKKKRISGYLQAYPDVVAHPCDHNRPTHPHTRPAPLTQHLQVPQMSLHSSLAPLLSDSDPLHPVVHPLPSEAVSLPASMTTANQRMTFVGYTLGPSRLPPCSAYPPLPRMSHHHLLRRPCSSWAQ